MSSHTVPMKKRQANQGDSGLLVAYTQLNVFLNDSTYTLWNQEEKHLTPHKPNHLKIICKTTLSNEGLQGMP